MNYTGKIRCTTTGRTYSSKQHVCCKSSNLIYCLVCKRCGKMYVGQTQARLMDRCQTHLRNIRTNVETSIVGAHFNSAFHKKLDDLEIYVVDFINAHPKSDKAAYLRNLIEFNWIQRLHSNAPLGLNIADAPFGAG